MHIGSKISFKETININNSNFISLLDDNNLKIYNKVLDNVNNELADSNIKILNDLENNILNSYFKYKSLEVISKDYNINISSVYERIRRPLRKVISYINHLVSLEIYNKDNSNTYIPIEILNISKISYNTLKRIGINTINDLINYSLEDLITRNLFGNINLGSIVNQVHTLGYIFKDEYILDIYKSKRYILKK